MSVALSYSYSYAYRYRLTRNHRFSGDPMRVDSRRLPVHGVVPDLGDGANRVLFVEWTLSERPALGQRDVAEVLEHGT